MTIKGAGNVMTKQTDINQYDLADLLVDEIQYACIWYDEKTETDWIKLTWRQEYYNDMAVLRHDKEQTFTIMISRCGGMWKQQTIDVDEILDIVL